jgi:type IV secretory pathway VirB3-like protein
MGVSTPNASRPTILGVISLKHCVILLYGMLIVFFIDKNIILWLILMLVVKRLFDIAFQHVFVCVLKGIWHKKIIKLMCFRAFQ